MVLARVRQRPGSWQRSVLSCVATLEREKHHQASCNNHQHHCPTKFPSFRSFRTAAFRTAPEDDRQVGSGSTNTTDMTQTNRAEHTADATSEARSSRQGKKADFLSKAGFDDDDILHLPKVEDGDNSGKERLPPWSSSGTVERSASMEVPSAMWPRKPIMSPLSEQETAETHSPSTYPWKSPRQVAMEEFAALDRKLSGGGDAVNTAKAKKTPEQAAMEEFAALERKLSGGGIGVGTPARGTRKMGKEARPSKVLAKPKEPEGSECCGTGCANCVWIDYWQDLQDWEDAERAREREEAGRQ